MSDQSCSSEKRGGGGSDGVLRNTLRLGEKLVGPLSGRFPRLGAEAARAAVSKAVSTWFTTDPEATEPPPPGFLWTIACRELGAEAKSEAARRRREEQWGSTEPQRSTAPEPPLEARITADEALAACFEDTLVRLEAHLPRGQAAILRPWLERKRGVDGYLDPLMAATGMDQAEARAALPRVKGRLRDNLRRRPEVKQIARRFRRLWDEVDEAGRG